MSNQEQDRNFVYLVDELIDLASTLFVYTSTDYNNSYIHACLEDICTKDWQTSLIDSQ